MEKEERVGMWKGKGKGKREGFSWPMKELRQDKFYDLWYIIRRSKLTFKYVKDLILKLYKLVLGPKCSYLTLLNLGQNWPQIYFPLPFHPNTLDIMPWE